MLLLCFMTLSQRDSLVTRIACLKTMNLRTFNSLSQHLLEGIRQTILDSHTEKPASKPKTAPRIVCMSREHVGCCVTRVVSYRSDLSIVQIGTDVIVKTYSTSPFPVSTFDWVPHGNVKIRQQRCSRAEILHHGAMACARPLQANGETRRRTVQLHLEQTP